ncbi:MAG: ABC transporter substrate-binding protein [Chloroflexi bacterium]|nr:ABC transporter substrate-binding protein [Chloroflexota bacterium]
MSRSSVWLRSIGPGVVALAFVLAACAPAAAPAPLAPAQQAAPAAPARPAAAPAAPAAAAPKSGGVLEIAFNDEPANWDDHISPLPSMAPFAYQALLRHNPETSEMEPLLAKSWEWQGPTTLVVRLQQGVKWQNKPPVNGREFTADDVVFSIKRLATDDARFLWRADFQPVKKVEAVDKYTAKFTFEKPFVPFLDKLANYKAWMGAKEVFDQYGDASAVIRAVGTGPYMVTEHRAGVDGKAVKSANFWMKDRPYLDGLHWTIINDEGQRLAALRTGKLHAIYQTWGGVTTASVRALQRTNPDVVAKTLAVTWPTILVMDNTRKPFNDLRVRKAIHLAIDRQEMINVIFDGVGHVVGPVDWALVPQWAISKAELEKMPGWRQPKDQDIAEAKKLLAEAGYPSGLTIEAEASEYYKVLNLRPMEVAKSQLAKIGVTVNINLQDQATYFDWDNTRKAYFRARGFTTYPDPDAMLFTRYYSKGGRNVGNYKDSAVDDLIEKQRSELDSAKRKQMILDIQKRLIDQAPYIFTFVEDSWAVHQPFVKGLVPHPSDVFGRTEQIWLDK